MPSYERVTRSKAVSTKKEDVIERPNEIKEEGLIIDHSIRVIENREMSIEKPKENNSNQTNWEQECLSPRKTERFLIFVHFIGKWEKGGKFDNQQEKNPAKSLP